MRTLYTILEGIFDIDNDFNIPDEVEEIVKICEPVKFEKFRNWDGKYGYVCKKTQKADEMVSKMIKLFENLPTIQFKNHINNKNTALVGYTPLDGEYEDYIIIGIPDSDTVLCIETYGGIKSNRNTYINIFKDESATKQLGLADRNRELKWVQLPIMSVYVIKNALLK